MKKTAKKKTAKTKGVVSVELAKQYGITVPVEKEEGAKYLSPNEIGGILNVTGEAVKQWIYLRRLPAVKLSNGYWRVKVSDLEHFLQNRHAHRKQVFVEASAEIKAAVKAMGFEVVEASNMADALLKLVAIPPVLMVLDMDSKVISAFGLLDRVREIKTIKRTPILALGSIAENDLDKAIALGIKGVTADSTKAIGEIKQLLNIE